MPGGFFLSSYRELKQQRRPRLRKCHFKSEVVPPQTLSLLIPSRLIREMLANAFEVEF